MDTRSSTDFTVDVNVAFRLPDKSVNLTQPQSGALAFALGREERLEYMSHNLAAHPAAGISNGDPGE